MNAKELATKMLEYADAQERANALKAEIESAVLELGETQKVGNVKAVYRSGRKKYDYETAARPVAPNDVVAEYTTQPAPRVDWRGICKALDIADVPFEQSEPSVSVALVA